MKVVHVSPTHNRESIMTRGLIPTEIKLKHHLESFRESDLCTKDGKILYTWQDSIYYEKFIKDTIFCKVWLHPRNDMFIEGDEDYVDYRTVFNKYLRDYDTMTYDVYIAEAPDQDSYTLHEQTPSEDIYTTSWHMPEEYTHDDKRLVLFKVPVTDFKIVGAAQFYFDNNRYNIKILR